MLWRVSVVVGLVAILSVPVQAGHTKEHYTGWFEYQMDDEDEVVLYCNALGLAALGADFFLHDRRGSDEVAGFPVPGAVAHHGGGTFIFQDTNGIPGIQIGGMAPTAESPLGLDDVRIEEAGAQVHLIFEDPFGDECPNGDTLHFAFDTYVNVPFP